MAIGATALAVGLLLTGCAVDEPSGGADSTTGGSEPITVGIVTSTTGPYASQGASFINGFEGGLDFATGGTGEVAGRQVNVVIANDNGDPATGTAAAKDLMGQGAKFLVGPTNSAVALPVSEIAVQNGGTYIAGASGSSALLANDHNVFVSGGGSWMPNQALFEAVPDAKKIVFIGQDYQYGQDQAALLKTLGESKGIDVQSVLLPSTTQDFTAGVLQAKALEPDLLYVGWQGDGTAQLYQALGDQGVYDSTQVITVLTSRPAIPLFAAAAGDKIADTIALTPYFEGIGADNAEEKAMLAYAADKGEVVDYAHPQGFVAAQMIVQAIEATNGELEQADVAAALEGWSFESPWGAIQIRAEDHLLTVPTYAVHYVEDGDDFTADVIEEFNGNDIAPAVDKSLP